MDLPSNAPKVWDIDLNPVLEMAPAEELYAIATLCRKQGWRPPSPDFIEAYDTLGTDASKYVKLIGHEVIAYGSNDFIGPSKYIDIVKKVARKYKASFPKDTQNVMVVEEAIMMKLFETMVEKMTDDERREFMKGIGVKKDYMLTSFATLAPSAGVTLAMLLGRMTTLELAAFLVRQSTAALASKGIATLAPKVVATAIGPTAELILGRGLSFLGGPVGWGIAGLSFLYGLAQPSYRVTVPVVLHVAMLRRLGFFVRCSNDACGHYLEPDAKFCSHCGTPVQK